MTKVKLGILINQTKLETKQAVNEVFARSGLPAYMREGVLLELLYENEKEKNRELTAEYEESRREMYEELTKKEKQEEAQEEKAE